MSASFRTTTASGIFTFLYAVSAIDAQGGNAFVTVSYSTVTVQESLSTSGSLLYTHVLGAPN